MPAVVSKRVDRKKMTDKDKGRAATTEEGKVLSGSKLPTKEMAKLLSQRQQLMLLHDKARVGTKSYRNFSYQPSKGNVDLDNIEVARLRIDAGTKARTSGTVTSLHKVTALVKKSSGKDAPPTLAKINTLSTDESAQSHQELDSSKSANSGGTGNTHESYESKNGVDVESFYSDIVPPPSASPGPANKSAKQSKQTLSKEERRRKKKEAQAKRRQKKEAPVKPAGILVRAEDVPPPTASFFRRMLCSAGPDPMGPNLNGIHPINSLEYINGELEIYSQASSHSVDTRDEEASVSVVANLKGARSYSYEESAFSPKSTFTYSCEESASSPKSTYTHHSRRSVTSASVASESTRGDLDYHTSYDESTAFSPRSYGRHQHYSRRSMTSASIASGSTRDDLEYHTSYDESTAFSPRSYRTYQKSMQSYDESTFSPKSTHSYNPNLSSSSSSESSTEEADSDSNYDEETTLSGKSSRSTYQSFSIASKTDCTTFDDETTVQPLPLL